MKHISSVLILVLLLCGTLCGCSRASGSGTRFVITRGFRADEVARIGDAVVTDRDLYVRLADTTSAYTDSMGADFYDQEIDGVSFRELVRNDCFAKLVEIKTLNLMAEEEDISLSEEEENRTLFAADACYSALDDAARETLHLHDASELTQMYREALLADKVYRHLIRDVNPEVSDDEARTVTAAQIVLYKQDGNDRRDEASSIVSRLNAGERFETLISDFNEAAEDTIALRNGTSDPALCEAAFALNTGEVSAVTETADACVILKCISSFDRGETAANKAQILKLRRQQAFLAVYEPYAKALPRRLNEPLYETILPDDALAAVDVSFQDIYENYFPEE